MDQKVPGSNLTDTNTSFDTLCCQGHNPVSGMEFGISYIKNHTTQQWASFRLGTDGPWFELRQRYDEAAARWSLKIRPIEAEESRKNTTSAI